MTAFPQFANLADVVLLRDSAPFSAAGFGVSCAVSSRSHSTT
jgi:hypothetical protein